jgi:hypothetical protein
MQSHSLSSEWLSDLITVHAKVSQALLKVDFEEEDPQERGGLNSFTEWGRHLGGPCTMTSVYTHYQHHGNIVLRMTA